MPKADPQRNGKPFVLPVTAGRGRSRGRKSSAGAAGAQAVALEEATNRATACGRGVTRTTPLRAVGAKAPRKKANGHVEAAAETWLGVVFFILRRSEPPSCSWWRGKRLAG